MQPPEFDLCKVDRYVSYLGELETANPSIASYDIYRDVSDLLVHKRSAVGQRVALAMLASYAESAGLVHSLAAPPK